MTKRLKRKAAKVMTRMVDLFCQECGGTFRYRYPGTGSYRSFCRACNGSSTTWRNG